MDDDEATSHRNAGIELVRKYETARKLKEAEKKKAVETSLGSIHSKLEEGEEVIKAWKKIVTEVQHFHTNSAKFFSNLQVTQCEEKRGHSNGAPALQDYFKKMGANFENTERLINGTLGRLKDQQKFVEDMKKEVHNQKSKLSKQLTENHSNVEKLYLAFEKSTEEHVQDVWLTSLHYHSAVTKYEQNQASCWNNAEQLIEKSERILEERVMALKAVGSELVQLQSQLFIENNRLGEDATVGINTPVVVPADPKAPPEPDHSQNKHLFNLEQNLIEYPFGYELEKDGELSTESGKLFKSFKKRRIVVTRSGFLHIFKNAEAEEPKKSFFLPNYQVEKGKDYTIYLSTKDDDPHEKRKSLFGSRSKDKFPLKAAYDSEAEAWVAVIQHRSAKPHSPSQLAASLPPPPAAASTPAPAPAPAAHTDTGSGEHGAPPPPVGN
eukprot:TRINITY_DN1151_c0_g1_i3.p1 TRINITY_DN1151_c0_g1~~TRINITY_DN1151_c0_g1_i3.p1  ORF type:complete len:438 (+),score=120.60 TRINITY_DN1151_c0_g1_i3:49-1362(+)